MMHNVKFIRGIRLAWAAYGKLKHVFKVDIPIFLKCKTCNQSVQFSHIDRKLTFTSLKET